MMRGRDDLTHDDLDDLLAGWLRPAPAAPAGLEDRILAGLRRRDEAPAADLRPWILDRLAITATERGVASIDLDHPAPPPAGAAARRLAERARAELAQYFEGRRSYFSIPVDLEPLPAFQKCVLDAAARIPFGQARSYSWIARAIDRPRAVRAVGTALGRNPVPFIVPCHRVLRSDGSLGGYGLGLDLKRRLLELEHATPPLEGCASTRIVCRTGCSSGQHVHPDHLVLFASLDDAVSVGYRPCRACRPDSPAAP
jgi:O-6-methylguanine DNA methyltransferase